MLDKQKKKKEQQLLVSSLLQTVVSTQRCFMLHFWSVMQSFRPFPQSTTATY